MSRTPIVLAALGCGLFILGSNGCSKTGATATWKLPVDAKQLPGTTTLLDAEQINGTREDDAHVKKMFTASELGSEICRIHASDPANVLKRMGNSDDIADAKHFFTAANLADVQSILTCGELLGGNLDGNFQTAIAFTDDASTKQEVGIIQLKMTDIPTSDGFSKHAFSGINGFCRTTDTSKPNAPTTDCTATSDAAMNQGTSWFFGSRAALESVAKTITAPKPDLSTQVSALNDGANAVEGLSSNRISADVASAKPFLSAPCTWGAVQSAGGLSDFMTACFPNTEQKIIDEIDTKIRAAAFEIDDSVLKAGGVHGNIVLVARDEDSAKIVEKDLNDFETDWKSSLENNEAKIIKQAKTDPVSREEKRWAIIVDNFTHALEKAKVVRSGRTVKLGFNEPLDASDKADLTDNDAKSADRRTAIADLLDAVQSKKPVPLASLSKIVGTPWATYLIAESTFDPKSLPADCSGPKPKAVKGKPAPVADPKCVAPIQPPDNQFGVDNAAKNASK
jgi:hypothetical protein